MINLDSFTLELKTVFAVVLTYLLIRFGYEIAIRKRPGLKVKGMKCSNCRRFVTERFQHVNKEGYYTCHFYLCPKPDCGVKDPAPMDVNCDCPQRENSDDHGAQVFPVQSGDVSKIIPIDEATERQLNAIYEAAHKDCQDGKPCCSSCPKNVPDIDWKKNPPYNDPVGGY